MSPTVTSIDELDLEISVASIAFADARRRWSRCPSSENEERVAAAAAEVDRLLDKRLAARP